MDLNIGTYYAMVINYFQHNIYIAIILAGAIFLLLIRKPKLFFTLVIIVAINIALLYVISYTSSIGVNQKKNLIQKSELNVKKDLIETKERKVK
jgi:hypothetical protein